jgi:hypothetical protein
MVLFSSKFFYKMDVVALSVVFDKYCPIIGLKDLSRKLQINYEINYYLYFYLMLYNAP